MSFGNIFKNIKEEKEVLFSLSLVTSSYPCAIVYNTLIELHVSPSLLLNYAFFACLF